MERYQYPQSAQAPAPARRRAARPVLLSLLVAMAGLAVLAAVVAIMILGPWFVAARQESEAHDPPGLASDRVMHLFLPDTTPDLVATSEGGHRAQRDWVSASDDLQAVAVTAGAAAADMGVTWRHLDCDDQAIRLSGDKPVSVDGASQTGAVEMLVAPISADDHRVRVSVDFTADGTAADNAGGAGPAVVGDCPPALTTIAD